MKNTETYVDTLTGPKTGLLYSVYSETVGEDRGEEFYAQYPTWQRPVTQYNCYLDGEFVCRSMHLSTLKEFLWSYEHPEARGVEGSRFD